MLTPAAFAQVYCFCEKMRCAHFFTKTIYLSGAAKPRECLFKESEDVE
jgi:hypothetical protein